MANLALHGGPKVREGRWPAWPVHGPEEREALLEVLESGRWGRAGGTKVSALEQRFAEMHGVRFGIAATNGTHTLQIALQAAGILPGDEVIVPSYTFLATATAPLAVGALPVFADIDPDSVLLDPVDVEAKITERTRAIIPVHYGGLMCPMDRFQALARKYSLKLIEDSAQAHMSQYDGKWTGQWGDFASFSFQASKNATGGEGGMVLTDDPDLATLARSYQNLGRLPQGGFYDHFIMGSNYRLTEFQGALLLAQIGRLEHFMAIRERNAALLNRLLAKIPGITPAKREPKATKVDYHLYVFHCDAAVWGVSKAAVMKALAAEGIPCGGGYVPLHTQPIFSKDKYVKAIWQQFRGSDPTYAQDHLPKTALAESRVIRFTQEMLLGTEEDMALIARALQKVYENRHELIAK